MIITQNAINDRCDIAKMSCKTGHVLQTGHHVPCCRVVLFWHDTLSFVA